MTTGLPPPPPGMDLTQDRRAEIIAVSVATWVLALAAVIYRIVNRRVRCTKLWLDDWSIIMALPPSLGHVLAIAAYGVSQGFGLHVWAAKSGAAYASALALFISEICYPLTLVAAKLSILSFYLRVFAVCGSIKPPVLIVSGIVCAWGVATVLVPFFQCLPTHAVWERFNPTHPMNPGSYTCGVDQVKFFYGSGIPDIATDLMILILPLPYIYRLQLARAQRFALGCIFLVGIFVTAVSVVRLCYIVDFDSSNPDITWNFVTVAIWSIVEGNVLIVCACLPFLGPLVSKVSLGFFVLAPTSFNRLRPSQQSEEPPPKGYYHTWGVTQNQGSLTTYIESLNREKIDSDKAPTHTGLEDVIDVEALPHVADVASAEAQQRNSISIIPARGIMVTTNVYQQ